MKRYYLQCKQLWFIDGMLSGEFRCR